MIQKTMHFAAVLARPRSRKTASCCLENLWVRAIDEPLAVNSLPECFQAIPWKIYAEAKTKRITSNNRFLRRFADSRLQTR
jgi:hypothetical protein